MNRTSKQILLFAACGLLILGAAAPSFSRVFWRRRAVTLAERLGAAGRWQSVLRSSVSINGGGGRLEVIGGSGSLDSAMRELRNIAGFEFLEFETNESMSRATVRSGDEILRVIALKLEDQVLMFAIVQSPEDFARSLAPPSSNDPREPPFYPDSKVTSAIRVEATGARLEISAASAGAGSIHAFFDSSLALDGWSRLIPPGTAGALREGLGIFQKGSEICCILVQPSGPESIITILRKRVGVK